MFVKRKRQINILNCVVHRNRFPKPGIQILIESASKRGQPASWPIFVLISAAHPDMMKSVAPDFPQN